MVPLRSAKRLNRRVVLRQPANQYPVRGRCLRKMRETPGAAASVANASSVGAPCQNNAATRRFAVWYGRQPLMTSALMTCGRCLQTAYKNSRVLAISARDEAHLAINGGRCVDPIIPRTPNYHRCAVHISRCSACLYQAKSNYQTNCFHQEGCVSLVCSSGWLRVGRRSCSAGLTSKNRPDPFPDRML